MIQLLTIVDVATQCELHVAQLGRGWSELGAEAIDRFHLLRRQHVVRAFGGLRQLRQLLLGVLELLGEFLLLGAELLSASASMCWIISNGRHDTPRPRRSDKCGAAGHLLDRVDDEVAVVGERLRDLLPEQ